ncbi:MAG: 50S ribosomal protein L9 [Rhodospirillales bacterium]|nr:50S ribosomal protein L9 [Rhodospirillales bacterium]MCW8862665.1 50S ribosomal protein L9 [Rhodospirillales bacterium]MCW8952886.1 50S ribosomal protein L9 [Rhodospirillales bacterium]MCW8969692.1 50S ribosomal protein L9 [Rhodospirillales bacterium]MCW9002478.1 50S ribosomal protein L9 [Rhodospirillales bacterium]
MEVILLERIEKLGQMGDVVKVRPGFARNFLLPNGKALRATEANRGHFETQRAQLEAENLKLRAEAEAVAKKVDGLKVTVIRQAGESGQLYGSVNSRDIATAVTESGCSINRQQVVLEHPIKTLGLFSLRVALHPEVFVTVTANVARSREEAEIQAKTGEVVSAHEDEIEEEVENAALFDEAEGEEGFDEDAGDTETAE